jgi:deazaflavin-dependent oxidoreductase (nitroreductase family)
MPLPHWMTTTSNRILNPLTLRLAGHGPMVELEHVGRTSGRTFRTPLMAFRHGDTVTIALTYGADVQWLKNITAAGRCRMRIHGGWLELGPPVHLDPSEGLARVPNPQRLLLRTVIDCQDFVALPVLGPKD